MENVIRELKNLVSVIEQSKRDGTDSSNFLKNYFFVGKAGTGKTTVAKAMADILHKLGLLASNKTVIKSGLDLQGSFIGQTKDNVNDIMNQAQGGVLFIDEAYTLGNGHYSQEAIDQLVALMTEPEHLNRTVVIFAGYPDAMERMIQKNEGLRSRVRGRIDFDDWDENDGVTFVRREALKKNLSIDNNAVEVLRNGLAEVRRRDGWANARDCVTVLSLLYESRALRQTESRCYITEDVDYAIKEFLRLRPNKIPINPFVRNDIPEPPVRVAVSEQVEMPPRPPDVVRTDIRQLEEVIESKSDERIDEELSDVDRENIFVALLESCIEAGYDQNHNKRIELVRILKNVLNGDNFPDNIMDIVENKTGKPAHIIIPVLRPQVPVVLRGMENAVAAEEKRLQEIERLKEEERILQDKEREKKLEKLRRRGPCPAGFSWHRCGDGWRCAGGSHYVSDAHLPLL